VVPREVWELINDLWLALSADAEQIRTREGRVGWLRRTIDECVRMNGVLASTMRRDEAMAFICIGQQIERADIAGRILRVRADSAAPTRGRDPYDEVHWMALLRSMAAYQPFPAGHAGAAGQRCHSTVPSPGRRLPPGRFIMSVGTAGHREETAG
jgi:uncharacterized alpha-E superfamily protein